MTQSHPRIYDEIADWYPLLTEPSEYVEEAAAYREAILRHAAQRPRTLLELGAGSGANAYHLKRDFACTLTDIAPRMLEHSRRHNPECEHIVADMRELRLGRTFDAVFVHDAIMYMLSEADLQRAITTVHVHLEPGGVAVFAPDFLRETFHDSTDHGGLDRDGRSLRYLEWSHDPDPADDTYLTEYVFLLQDVDGPARVVHDTHHEGLFARASWIRLLTGAGFEVHSAQRPVDDEQFDEIFVCIRR